MIQCCRCKETKDVSDFYQRKCKRGYSYMCKICDKLRVFKYQISHGYWNVILNNARLHSKERLKKGRIDAGICNISLENLEDKWKLQKGKCYYSNIDMIKERHSNWSCSLERLDNKLGYINNNIVLICQEFNTSCQWSLDKINIIPILLNQDIKLMNNTLNLSKRLVTTKNKDNIITDGIEYGFCRYCQNFIPLDILHGNFKKRGCRDCVRDYANNTRSTLSGYLSLLISTSRMNKKHMKHDITIDFLKQMYIKQNGRCAYSSIPLLLPNHKNEWTISLERINTKLGYIKEFYG